MLQIKSDVLRDIKTQVASDEKEQGFVCGCASNFECIDHIALIPGKESGTYFYTPDSHYANRVIENWAANEICFSGFIHSHTKGKRSFSENDAAFAEQLLLQYSAPFLWFGLAVVNGSAVEILFFKLSRRGTDCVLNQVEYQELL